MASKLAPFLMVAAGCMLTACEKECDNSIERYAPMPQPYESWFNAIPPQGSNQPVYYAVRSSDSLNQSFIQSYGHDISANNWISDPPNSPCGSYRGGANWEVLTTSIYPFRIHYGIQLFSSVEFILFFVDYHYHNPATGASRSFYFERKLVDGNLAGGNLEHLDTAVSYWGLRLPDVYKVKFDTTGASTFEDYPEYVLISTHYGIFEYKQLGGRVWSVTKFD